jgi:hypothetical protein
MNNYIDKYGLYHHKAVINGEPSSNNGWIYTAYAQKVGCPISELDLHLCFQNCEVYSPEKAGYILNRLPGKTSVPISRDEILGMTALGVLNLETSRSFDGWNFSPYPLPPFSLIKFVKQLWELKPRGFPLSLAYPVEFRWKHRNYFWQNNLDQLYRFAFSVPLQDRHFMLKKWGKFSWLKPSHLFYATVAKVDSKFGKASGIRFLKYGTDIGEFINEMITEFPEDHPIVKAVRK